MVTKKVFLITTDKGVVRFGVNKDGKPNDTYWLYFPNNSYLAKVFVYKTYYEARQKMNIIKNRWSKDPTMPQKFKILRCDIVS